MDVNHSQGAICGVILRYPKYRIPKKGSTAKSPLKAHFEPGHDFLGTRAAPVAIVF